MNLSSILNFTSRFASCYLLIIACFIFGCEEREFTPKPKGYFKIDLPEKSYKPYQVEGCSFTFHVPGYSQVERDSIFFGKKVEDPCWLNIHLPEFSGSIHLSYKEIKEGQSLSKLVEDAHKLTFKHTIKADYIDERAIASPHGVSGMLYEVGGDAASSAQFYLTDSINHFLRGSLYFNITPNADSMSPVIQFVKADLIHLIQTFRWENRDNFTY